MNRIILIGNGFDLAHKLDTRYCDFIDYLWKNIIDGLKKKIDQNTTNYEDENKLFSLKLVRQSFLFFFQDIELSKYEDLKIAITRDSNRERYKCLPQLEFKNKFFESLTNEFSCGNWVDIETFYYEELKKHKNDQKEIDKLNLDFKQIKKLLEEYLSNVENEKRKQINDLYNYIYSQIRADNLSIKGYNQFIETLTKRLNRIISDEKEQARSTFSKSSGRKEYPDAQEILDIKKGLGLYNYTSDFIKDKCKQDISQISFLTYPDNILFLTFNYTNTEEKYLKRGYNPQYSSSPSPQVNHIHGQIKDTNNPIIFGYGDEHDEEYAALEKAKTKGLLENIKSMKYSETSNYRDFERFLDSDTYQVFIMGHSCGLTDKTLLKTLFEHDNCVSIKPYYYKKGEEDNFSEIIESISRCFDNKALMRSRIVAKTLCDPLPQYS